MNDFYLTEQRLKQALERLYPGAEMTNNRTIPEVNARFRPDYYLPEHRIVVEFDGFRHYTLAKVQEADREKDSLLAKHNIRVVRIPYFVQLNHIEQTRRIFHKNANWTNKFHNGFVGNSALLPADFNSIGSELFLTLLKRETLTLETKKEIVATLVCRCQKSKTELVIPAHYHNDSNYLNLCESLSGDDIAKAERAIRECN